MISCYLVALSIRCHYFLPPAGPATETRGDKFRRHTRHRRAYNEASSSSSEDEAPAVESIVSQPVRKTPALTSDVEEAEPQLITKNR